MEPNFEVSNSLSANLLKISLVASDELSISSDAFDERGAGRLSTTIGDVVGTSGVSKQSGSLYWSEKKKPQKLT